MADAEPWLVLGPALQESPALPAGGAEAVLDGPVNVSPILLGPCQESSLLTMGYTSLSRGSFKCVFKFRVGVMTLKMCHWVIGGRNGLDFCCGCLHGAEGPRILEHEWYEI